MSLPGTKATTPTATHAVVDALESYIQNQNLLGEIAELDEMLVDLVEMHRHNLLALKRVLQCIHKLLQSNSKYNVRFGSKIFHKLISVAIADSREDSGPHRQLVSNVLLCIQLHARKFPRVDSKFLLQQLWSLSLNSEQQPHAAQILVHLFDDFVKELGLECCTQGISVTQHLLQSEVREERKSAYFIMRKLLGIVERSPEVLQALGCSQQQWAAYVTVMENLEEQQSHLVLPTLSTLLPRLWANGHPHEHWMTWLRILYARLLQDNNILVLRWNLKYFLTHFTQSQLMQLDLLTEFLVATNRTQLYNVEGDVSLLDFSLDTFVSDSGVLLEAMAKVMWHCVPLLYWLQLIDPKNIPLMAKEVLFKLSTRVRTLQNTTLRRPANQRIFELFEVTINNLSLGDYMVFIESLFNTSDKYFEDYIRLINKIDQCENIGKDIAFLNKRGYETVAHYPHQLYHHEIFTKILMQLQKLPKAQHGWWRLFPVFLLNNPCLSDEHKRICLHFYGTEYQVDTSLLMKVRSLKGLQMHLLDKLNCKTKEEKSFILETCVDYFVMDNLKEWKQLEELQLNPMELLDQGTECTFHHLAKLMGAHNKRLENDNVLPAFVVSLKQYSSSKEATEGVMEYAMKHLTEEEYDKLTSDLVISCGTEATVKSEFLIIQGIFFGEITTGDARIEAAYAHKIIGNCFPDVKLRDRFISMATEQSDQIISKLLLMNNELSKKKPRYFENSKEHRIKIRIARTLLKLAFDVPEIRWSDQLWEALLEPNNQLNISYMYECLVAKLLPSFDLLLDRLRVLATLKPSQQVSLISVVHLYCVWQWQSQGSLDAERLQNVMSALLPHTMGAHFQTRLLAQLVLHKLAVLCDKNRLDLSIASALRTSIEATLEDKLIELQKDPRLMLSEMLQRDSRLCDAILYMTNAPFDEYNNEFSISDKLEMARAAFKAKRKTSAVDPPSLILTTNDNVQRKMNPINDLYLATTDTSADHELIVVASLIDKLPNLGGLARTCEVLGVRTLIMATKSDALKSDFTNLSMTAEKTLNIMEIKPLVLDEFLLEKQMAGYKIVGAEQTAHSSSFSNFKFPKKCVLLLGHEKHGIPVNLIGFLDHAVEIPQFGMVRSLNVHVTGSLFIWEYCKQHMAK